MPESNDSDPLSPLVADFLADLAHTNRSRHTRRAYATDLAQFSAFYRGPVGGITTEVIRSFGATLERLGPASRARKQAALASFLEWARRQGHLASDPMASVARVRPEPPRPRSVGRGPVEEILKVIPAAQRRDRLLFRLIFETGLRVSEALGVHLEDLDLTADDEHLSVLGKGGQQRTVLLDDANLVRQLRAYLKQTKYRHGPLFRAEKNSRGGPLRYQSVQERWAGYCARAGVSCTLHQLRHTHATELVNGGVGLATIRKRLGHKNLQTTLRYAEQSDAAADAEVRAWRRNQQRCR
ncbi:MAG: tyrosine-type recombinase/integrase [Planctomycetaceae bacterium]|nr:tyrosine-type recombinase/integrase [Planctomycetaceae bacterium]MBV8318350.1 tyrosine-type recombinase/integrase [Planctomycetaceae bacterium]